MPLTRTGKCYDWMDSGLCVLLQVRPDLFYICVVLSAAGSPTFQREKTWARIYQEFVQGPCHTLSSVAGFMIRAPGNCVLTLGTPDREDVHWGKISLLPSHCYAVIGQRLTLVPRGSA